MLKPWVSWWCLPRGIAAGSHLPQTAKQLPLHPHTHFREPICKKFRVWPGKNCPTGTKFPERRKLYLKSFSEKRTGRGFRSTLNIFDGHKISDPSEHSTSENGASGLPTVIAEVVSDIRAPQWAPGPAAERRDRSRRQAGAQSWWQVCECVRKLELACVKRLARVFALKCRRARACLARTCTDNLSPTGASVSRSEPVASSILRLFVVPLQRVRTTRYNSARACL